MNILVIGNGLDLAHGLLTKYGDFVELGYLKKFYMTKCTFLNCYIN